MSQIKQFLNGKLPANDEVLPALLAEVEAQQRDAQVSLHEAQQAVAVLEDQRLAGGNVTDKLRAARQRRSETRDHLDALARLVDRLREANAHWRREHLTSEVARLQDQITLLEAERPEAIRIAAKDFRALLQTLSAIDGWAGVNLLRIAMPQPEFELNPVNSDLPGALLAEANAARVALQSEVQISSLHSIETLKTELKKVRAALAGLDGEVA